MSQNKRLAQDNKNANGAKFFLVVLFVVAILGVQIWLMMGNGVKIAPKMAAVEGGKTGSSGQGPSFVAMPRAHTNFQSYDRAMNYLSSHGEKPKDSTSRYHHTLLSGNSLYEHSEEIKRRGTDGSGINLGSSPSVTAAPGTVTPAATPVTTTPL